MRLLKILRIAITNGGLFLLGIAGAHNKTGAKKGENAKQDSKKAAIDDAEDNAKKTARDERAEYEDDFQDLADYREKEGLPKTGSEEDNSTAAKLKIGDKEFFGKNAGQNKTDVMGEFTVNPQTATHAEGDVFYQAKKDGVNSTQATLILDRDPCKSCGINGGIRGMAKQLGITDLTVVSPSQVIKFNPQIKPIPNPFM